MLFLKCQVFFDNVKLPGAGETLQDHEMLKREEGVRSDRSRKWVKAQEVRNMQRHIRISCVPTGGKCFLFSYGFSFSRRRWLCFGLTGRWLHRFQFFFAISACSERGYRSMTRLKRFLAFALSPNSRKARPVCIRLLELTPFRILVMAFSYSKMAFSNPFLKIVSPIQNCAWPESSVFGYCLRRPQTSFALLQRLLSERSHRPFCTCSPSCGGPFPSEEPLSPDPAFPALPV